MKFSWSEIDKNIIGHFDLLIAFASYETRCLSLVNNIPHGTLSNAMVCCLSEYLEHSGDNLEALKGILKSKNIPFRIAELPHNEPLRSIDDVKQMLDEYIIVGKAKNILIDTTTFTHELLLMILWLFRNHYVDANVTFAYSNAKDYDYSDDAAQNSGNKWLSKGIGDIRSVLGYPGDLFPTKQTHLIVIVGYEYDRALSVISEIEPISLSLGFGKSDSYTTEVNVTNQKHYGAAEHFKEEEKAVLNYCLEYPVHKMLRRKQRLNFGCIRG